MGIVTKAILTVWIQTAIIFGTSGAEIQIRSGVGPWYGERDPIQECMAERYLPCSREDRYEQETEQEILVWSETDDASVDEVSIESEPNNNSPEVEEHGEDVVQTVALTPLYSVNGAVLDTGIQDYLYRHLCEAGIGWFYPYALLIAYQESNFDIYAVNPNGRDKGLLQYRVEYYAGLDPFNPFAEIDLFVQQMANRANAGCDTATMISRHNTSDWGEYNQDYVDHVMSWEGTLARIN